MKQKYVVFCFVFCFLMFGQALAADKCQRLKQAEKTEYHRICQTKEKIIFFEQRTVDVVIEAQKGTKQIEKAIVEGDYVNYQLSLQNGLFSTQAEWRKDVVQSYRAKVSQQQAEVMTEGDVQFSNLFVISCDSQIFVLDSCPQNPCWVVYSLDRGQLRLSVIDALDGKFLGYGVPPPSLAYISSGPVRFNPCLGVWNSHTYEDWEKSAKYWLDLMGYDTQYAKWPDYQDLQSDLFESSEASIWFEMAHGGYDSIATGCTSDGQGNLNVHPSDIDQWLEGKSPVRFSFLGSCDAMVETGEGTMAYALTKGQTSDTAVVGYKGIGYAECSLCWTYSFDWQMNFFEKASRGLSVGQSFDETMQDNLSCLDCLGLAGDESLQLVPLLEREIIADGDGDGIPDDVDNCPTAPNGPEAGTCTRDSENAGANCTNRSDCISSCTSYGECSIDQDDTDEDGTGDVCDNCPDDSDNDIDNDGICGDIDNCPTTPNGPAKGSCFNYFTHEVWGNCLHESSCQENSGEWYKWCDTFQGDQDGDGVGDVCADCPLDSRFEKTTFAEGIKYYTDRDYVLIVVPSQYLGLATIKTPNDEKNATDTSDYLTFNMPSDGTVYVGYDHRATSRPDWMSGFTDTGDDITISDTLQGYFNVYSKTYSAGECINLGGNKAPGFSGDTVSNYIVFY